MELESHRGSFTKHSVFCWQSLQLDATSNILAVTFLLMKDVSRREKPLISVRTTQVKCALSLVSIKCFSQGIIDMNRNGNSANFFSYVRNDKKSKELFASFLNEILISVISVSSIKFVFNA